MALRVRWADVADSPRDHFADWPAVPAARSACAALSGDDDTESEGEGDCSTRAPSECGAECARERLADIASGDETAQPSGSAASAAADTASHVASRGSAKAGRRGRGKDPSSSSSDPWAGTTRGGHASSAESWKDSKASWSSCRAAEDTIRRGHRGRRGRNEGRAAASGGASTWRQQGWGGRQQRGAPPRKFQCQFDVGIEEDETFGVVWRILGPHGRHVKRIAENSGAKLRLRGRGSGFKEGYEQLESTDPLMLCVSTLDSAGYETAKEMVSEHLRDIYAQYREFGGASAERAAGLCVRVHEGPRDGSY